MIKSFKRSFFSNTQLTINTDLRGEILGYQDRKVRNMLNEVIEKRLI